MNLNNDYFIEFAVEYVKLQMKAFSIIIDRVRA